MIDQRFIDLKAQELIEESEPQEMQLASANTGVTTDVGPYVGYRLNMPKGLNTRENQAKQSALIANTLGGGAVGVPAAGVGLTGDIVDVALMIANSLGADMPEKSGIWTTEDVTNWLASKGVNQENISGLIDKVLPSGATEEEKARAFSGGQTVGELAAPGTQLSLIGKAGKGVVKGGVEVGKKIIEAGKDLPVGMSIKSLDGTEFLLEKAPKIETKAFKNWFGDSKAVDDNGKPIVVYHGTTPDWSDEIKNDKYRTGKFFTTAPRVAERFGKTVVPAYVKVEKPFIVDAKGSTYAGIDTPKEMRGWAITDEVDTDLIAEYALKNGYDSAIIRNVLEGNASPQIADNFIVFNPTQIKSAISNKGTFDPKDPSILKGVGVGGTGAAMSQEENK